MHVMRMGIHSKIVLCFNVAGVLWPPNVPHLNCIGERFEMFNLHAYGTKCALHVYVFVESGFAKGYAQLLDSAVLVDVIITLAEMFCPT